MTAGGWGALLGSVLVMMATLVEAFEVMLLPRRVRRRLRFVRAYFHVTWGAWVALSRIVAPRTRTAWLGIYGPLSMVGLLVSWTVALLVSFAGVQWALQRGHSDPASLGSQLYFSGVTLFTLGYGDVTAPTALGKAVSVAEAGAGFGLIAIIIGYLPVLYQLFSRRETFVIRLDARAGSPPTAAGLLVRHASESDGLASLGKLLADCESWAAELLESHLSYPMLAYYRSQHDNESWLAALTAVMDTCALITCELQPVSAETGGDDTRTRPLPEFQARMTFATGRLTLVEMARVAAAVNTAVPGTTALPDRPAPEPTVGTGRLDAAELEKLRGRLDGAGLRLDDDAAARLEDLRDTYEPFAVRLATYLQVRLPPWVAPANAVDNWARYAGGPRARRIIDAAEERTGET